MGYKRPHLDVQSLSHFDIEMKLLKHSPWEGLVSHQTSALLEEYVFLDFESLVGVPLKLEIVKFQIPNSRKSQKSSASRVLLFL